MARAGRWRLALGGALAIVVVASCGAASSPFEPAFAAIPLYSDGVVLDASGHPEIVLVGDTAESDAAQQRRQDAWLAQGTVPGPERYADLAEQALRDIDTLVLPGGAAIAAASPGWRYVWPRDASFTAVALARTGHADDAHDILVYLRDMQLARSTEGVFEARYLPDGDGHVPDDRGLQLDGNGWVLWAVAEWYAAAGADADPGEGADGRADTDARSATRRAPDSDAQLEELRPLVESSLHAIRAHVDPETGLPGVFPDYWEVGERVPTLGTAAPLLAGVRASGDVVDALGLPPTGSLERLLEEGVDRFAPAYPRRLGGQQQDTAVAFLMPPFAPLDPAVEAAWHEAAESMARPAGGLAPGAGWKRDGVSWTPTTAMFGLTAAASGDTERATATLDWLDAHRTAQGALPEKVLWDGSPSAVAPLAWTASLVLLTLDELDRQADDG